MVNLKKTTLKKDLIEKMYLGIPYNSEGFKNWLVTTQILSEEKAQKQIELIRETDIEFWEPGESELFKLLGEWLEEALVINNDRGDSDWLHI